jgi:hypothetical protein
MTLSDFYKVAFVFTAYIRGVGSAVRVNGVNVRYPVSGQ